jgi:crotonobetainyl-CoA:carnitine CoA-transferase CaiB-like acyl-CoA transferase
MGVLDGIKVLEMARVPPAELPGMFLADMGADVLKIETPPAEAEDAATKRRAAFAYVNRNKRSLAVNMKAADGQAIFRKLAATADVIVEGFRPGVMKRLGGDYETLSAANPRLVYCSLSGFGHNGPYKDYPAHDGNYLSLAGVLNLIGEPDRKPIFPLNLVADYGGASMHGALGIMMALFARERTGRGQHVDVSYLDTSVALLAATPNMRFFWENFCKAIDRPDMVKFARKPDQFVRAANPEEVRAREEVEAIIRTRTRDEWYDFLVKADVCVGKVYEPDEVVADPQVQARDMIVEMRHPVHGTVKQFGQPIKLSDTPGTIRSAAPFSGEHTDQVLGELGMAAADIKALRDKKIVA